MSWRADIPLDQAMANRAIQRDWLTGSGQAGSATSDLGLPESSGGSPAPLFAGGWRPLVGADDPAVGDGLEVLARGDARVVVTGQQPGRLAGPLYTLYKIATTVALARRRTAEGHPTVPVYWSGDADDDHDEAFAPLVWDPAKEDFLELERGPGRKTPDRVPSLVGRLACATTVRTEARWLASRATGDDTVAALAELWNRAVERDWSWSRLQAEAVGCLFPGAGLVVVSGDDPAVHAAAGPLYERLRGDLPGLAAAAAERGSELEAAGYHAQLTGRSLARPLFRIEGEGRIPLEPDQAAEARDLRPGVLFRSPVQDWLLEPSAVVVGPGELAYLKQLAGVYDRLGIPRSALVPRLSGWIAPRETREPDPGPEADNAAGLAAGAGRVAGEELRRILEDELGVEPERATRLAQGRVRRFVKGAAAMLADEVVRQRRSAIAELPAWLYPQGGVQERTLAAGCAVALWGSGLLEDIAGAADEHLELGSRGDWRRFRFDRHDPADTKG